MESVFGRYRNLVFLVGLLFLQVLGLAVQVKRNTDVESSRLIRIWAVDAVTPFEKALVWTQSSTRDLWRNYIYLRGVRAENRQLKEQIEQLRLEQVRLTDDAEQARRLQSLLAFRERFISKTVAAQVIGSSGSEQSRSIYVDKGYRDGIRTDMAVITADGVVGKVLRVFGSKPFEASTSQVLLINDQSSGVGAILDKTRTQGVLRGTASGEVVLEKVMADETVSPGETIVTSGGDQIFPKGLPVGTVTKVSPGPEIFLNIRVRPSADLSRLEEVLIITEQQDRDPNVADGGGKVRAADILAQRLPSVPEQTASDPYAAPAPTSGLKIAPAVPAPPTQTGSTPATAVQKPPATAQKPPSTAQNSAAPGTAVKSASPTTKPASLATNGSAPSKTRSSQTPLLTTSPAQSPVTNSQPIKVVTPTETSPPPQDQPQ